MSEPKFGELRNVHALLKQALRNSEAVQTELGKQNYGSAAEAHLHLSAMLRYAIGEVEEIAAAAEPPNPAA
jgi:hypothetical protein